MTARSRGASSRSPVPIQVRVSYVRSLGAVTSTDCTKKVPAPTEGMIFDAPQKGACLVVWRGGKTVMTSTPIDKVAEGAGKSWEVTTKHNVYRVRVIS